MTDIIGRLLDEAEKAQRKGHLLLAEVCRDASDQLGLIIDERDRLRGALRDAIESIEHWASYASDYFREKHDLTGDLQNLRSALGEMGNE